MDYVCKYGVVVKNTFACEHLDRLNKDRALLQDSIYIKVNDNCPDDVLREKECPICFKIVKEVDYANYTKRY